MSRISLKFSELSSKNEGALITYMMAGYPTEKDSLSILRGMIKGGADIIELGFPFSDPLADGPVIQNAATVSLQGGAKVSRFFSLVKKIRKETELPLVLMTYSNILYHTGYERFIHDAVKAGIDGFILPDMSIEESDRYMDAAKAQKADTIFLASPNTTKNRLQKIAEKSSGFLYLVAVYGITGAKTQVQEYTIKALKNTKKIAGGKVPVGIGFGVSTPADVRRFITAGADAVIAGSVFLRLIEDTPAKKLYSTISAFTKTLKRQTVRIKE